MSLIDLYINDGGNIRRIGDNPHDMLMIWKGKLWYHNLQNGDGCRLGEESEWYSFVENADEYGYNCDPRKTENSSEKPNNCETCKHNKLEWYSEICDSCCGNNNHYEPKTEPQTGEMMTEEEFDSMLARVLTGNNEPQISPSDCKTCKHDLWSTPRTCGKCFRQEDGKPSMYEPKTEPQAERSE